LSIAAFCCGLTRSVAVAGTPRHILGMDKEVDKGLTAFVATLQGPAGQIPFERALVRHLPLFLSLRRRGLTWPRIASLLTARGVRRPDGRLISAEQLRGVISRQMRRSGMPTSDRVEPISLGGEDKLPRKPFSVTGEKRSEQSASAEHPRVCHQPIDKAPSSTGRMNDVRAFMGRAARLRRNFGDPC
jgi:hypothetical protein